MTRAATLLSTRAFGSCRGSMSGRQRRLAAIFFSDMKGFSSQMDADEEGTLDRLDRHNAVMRSQIEAHGGRVIKTVGDAFMAEFTSSVAAVKCALDCLRDFDTQNADVSDDDAHIFLQKPHKSRIKTASRLHKWSHGAA